MQHYLETGGDRDMDLEALFALYPVAKEIASKSLEVRKWMVKKAKEDDHTLILQLQALEEIRSLRAYTLNTSIISAVLSNPHLSEDEVRERILLGARFARTIAEELKGASP